MKWLQLVLLLLLVLSQGGPQKVQYDVSGTATLDAHTLQSDVAPYSNQAGVDKKLERLPWIENVVALTPESRIPSNLGTEGVAWRTLPLSWHPHRYHSVGNNSPPRHV